jgi:hypothetical protein
MAFVMARLRTDKQKPRGEAYDSERSDCTEAQRGFSLNYLFCSLPTQLTIPK